MCELGVLGSLAGPSLLKIAFDYVNVSSVRQGGRARRFEELHKSHVEALCRLFNHKAINANKGNCVR